MPAYKVLQEESINGREPQPVGTVVILSELEAAPFLANKAIEVAGEPETPAPSIETQPVVPVHVEE